MPPDLTSVRTDGGKPPKRNLPQPKPLPKKPATNFDIDRALTLAEFSNAVYEGLTQEELQKIETPLRRMQSGTLECVQYKLEDDVRGKTEYIIATNPLDDIVVAFRGSDRELEGDWASNLNIGFKKYAPASGPKFRKRRIHRGTYLDYLDIRPRLEQKLRTLITRTAAPRIYFTGHSRGAALATIAALDMRVAMDRGKLPQAHVGTYNFGSYRVMNRECGRFYHQLVKESYIIENYNDIAAGFPALGTKVNGYVHAKNLLILHDDGHLRSVNGEKHRFFKPTTKGHKTRTYLRNLALAGHQYNATGCTRRPSGTGKPPRRTPKPRRETRTRPHVPRPRRTTESRPPPRAQRPRRASDSRPPRTDS